MCALLEEMGWAPSDLRGMRTAGTTGADLMLLLAAHAPDPSLSHLAAHLRMPPHKARRLRRVADAVVLFNAISDRPCQPRLSEVELRVWLAGSGCCGPEAGWVVKLLRALVAAGEGAGTGRVTFWEWAVGWQWVTHAMEVYGVDWRSAT